MHPTDTAKSNDIITAKNVDLSTCDRELVQYPEAIQPHGVMLTVDDHSNLIVHASANCAQLLGGGPDSIIGKSADNVLGPTGRDLIGKLRRMALDGGPVHVAREVFRQVGPGVSPLCASLRRTHHPGTRKRAA